MPILRLHYYKQSVPLKLIVSWLIIRKWLEPISFLILLRSLSLFFDCFSSFYLFIFIITWIRYVSRLSYYFVSASRLIISRFGFGLGSVVPLSIQFNIAFGVRRAFSLYWGSIFYTLLYSTLNRTV